MATATAKKPKTTSGAPAAAHIATTWDLARSQKAVKDNTPADFAVNKAYVLDGNHWQNKDGWIGPRPPDLAPTADDLWKRIEALFRPRRLLAQCVKRAANALLKRKPSVALTVKRAVTDATPETDAEKALQDEGGSHLATWVNDQQVPGQAKAAVRHSRAFGVGYLRLWVPSRFATAGADGTVRVQAEDVPHSLSMIRVTAATPENACRYVDPATQAEVLVFLEGKDDHQVAELHYIEGEDTVIRRVGKAGDLGTVRMQLGGLLLMVAVEGDKLINDPERQQQKALDYYSTVLSRILETCGFPERYIWNAEPTGEWRRVPDGQNPTPGLTYRPAEDGGTEELVPAARTMGAATTTELTGVLQKGDGGASATHATPGVYIKEPTDPAFAIAAINEGKAAILEGCHQEHVLTNSDARASGKSRQQARADFDADVGASRETAEAALRLLFAAALALAEYFAKGSAGQYTATLRVTVSLNVQLAPPDPEDIKLDSELVDKGQMDIETFMARAGIEDPDAELKRIDGRPGAQLKRRKDVVEILEGLALVFPEADPIELAVLAGFTREEVQPALGGVAAARAQKAAEDAEIRRAMSDRAKQQASGAAGRLPTGEDDDQLPVAA